MRKSGPTFAFVPLEGIKPSKRVEFYLRSHVSIAQNVIPCYIELLAALRVEKHDSWSLDLIIVFKVKF